MFMSVVYAVQGGAFRNTRCTDPPVIREAAESLEITTTPVATVTLAPQPAIHDVVCCQVTPAQPGTSIAAVRFRLRDITPTVLGIDRVRIDAGMMTLDHENDDYDLLPWLQVGLGW